MYNNIYGYQVEFYNTENWEFSSELHIVEKCVSAAYKGIMLIMMLGVFNSTFLVSKFFFWKSI